MQLQRRSEPTTAGYGMHIQSLSVKLARSSETQRAATFRRCDEMTPTIFNRTGTCASRARLLRPRRSLLMVNCEAAIGNQSHLRTSAREDGECGRARRFLVPFRNEVARGSRGRQSTSLRHVTLTCALSHNNQHAMRALFANIQ